MARQMNTHSTNSELSEDDFGAIVGAFFSSKQLASSPLRIRVVLQTAGTYVHTCRIADMEWVTVEPPLVNMTPMERCRAMVDLQERIELDLALELSLAKAAGNHIDKEMIDAGDERVTSFFQVNRSDRSKRPLLTTVFRSAATGEHYYQFPKITISTLSDEQMRKYASVHWVMQQEAVRSMEAKLGGRTWLDWKVWIEEFNAVLFIAGFIEPDPRRDRVYFVALVARELFRKGLFVHQAVREASKLVKNVTDEQIAAAKAMIGPTNTLHDEQF
jgi:hypothetical protein